MAKRKSLEDDENSPGFLSEAEKDSPKAKAKVKPKKPANKDTQGETGGSEKKKKKTNSDAAKEKTIKKPKLDSSPSKRDGEITIRTNKEHERYIDLGKKKRATVREYKGASLLDIREFYGDDGDEKPGKKGISLTKDQWQTLKTASDSIDQLFANL